jgi:Tol biopolymer transport system component
MRNGGEPEKVHLNGESAMKALSITTVLVFTLAAGLWAFALRDSLPAAAFETGSIAAPAELLPYPGADDLVVRRVLAEADGLFSPSPDGSLMSHMDPASGNLAVRDLRTGESHLLTEDGRLGEGTLATYFSRFSPDGRRIAYQWGNLRNEWAIRIIDLDTKEIREVVPDHEHVYYLEIGSWSPSGDSIAAVLYFDDGSTRIAIVDVESATHTILRSFDWQVPASVTFSPDGKWLAYDRAREEGSPGRDIHLLAVNGSREVALIRNPGSDQVVGWMPGGGPFFYLSGEAGRQRLLAVEVEDGHTVSEPQEVYTDLWYVSPRGFSENAFFYVQMPERRMAHVARLDVETATLATLEPLAPAKSLEWPQFMTWSPDGDRVAYIAGTGRVELVIRSLASGAERTIPTPFRSVHWARPEWSPTGDRLAVDSCDAPQRCGVFLLDLEDGSVERVVRSDRQVSWNINPRWSRDGRSLYVARADLSAEAVDIVRVDLASGEEEALYRTWSGPTNTLRRIPAFAVSPDERQLAVGEVSRDSGTFEVRLISLVGGGSRVLTRLTPPDGSIHTGPGLDWAPDGRHVVFGPPWKVGDERTLWIVDRRGAELRQLATFVSDGGQYLRPRIHPDGRRISVVAGRNRWEIWTMENLRPVAFSGTGPQRSASR